MVCGRQEEMILSVVGLELNTFLRVGKAFFNIAVGVKVNPCPTTQGTSVFRVRFENSVQVAEGFFNIILSLVESLGPYDKKGLVGGFVSESIVGQFEGELPLFILESGFGLLKHCAAVRTLPI